MLEFLFPMTAGEATLAMTATFGATAGSQADSTDAAGNAGAGEGGMGDAAFVAGAGVGGWQVAQWGGGNRAGGRDGCMRAWAGLGMPGETVASVEEGANACQ